MNFAIEEKSALLAYSLSGRNIKKNLDTKSTSNIYVNRTTKHSLKDAKV